MRNSEKTLLVLALFSWSARGTAQPMPPRAPPQAAFDACASLRAGDACSFTLEAQAVQGVCRAGPDGSQVACAPDDLPGHGRGGPPPEAVSACANLRAGDACSFSFGAGAVDGACRAGPDSAPLACAPKDMPGHGHRGPPPEAVSACANLRAGDACAFTFQARTVDGACRAGPDGSRLACAPKDMPPPASRR